MTLPGMRVRAGLENAWAIATPNIDGSYTIEVRGLNGPVTDEALRDQALRALLAELSRLRSQVYSMLPHPEASRR